MMLTDAGLPGNPKIPVRINKVRNKEYSGTISFYLVHRKMAGGRTKVMTRWLTIGFVCSLVFNALLITRIVLYPPSLVSRPTYRSLVGYLHEASVNTNVVATHPSMSRVDKLRKLAVAYGELQHAHGLLGASSHNKFYQFQEALMNYTSRYSSDLLLSDHTARLSSRSQIYAAILNKTVDVMKPYWKSGQISSPSLAKATRDLSRLPSRHDSFGF